MNWAAARRSGSVVISSAFGTWGQRKLLRSFEFSEPPSNYRTWGGLTGISLRAAVQARMVLTLAEGLGFFCTGVGSWVVTCPPWCCGSIDPHITSFSDIGGFQVCLNFVSIDTIFIHRWHHAKYDTLRWEMDRFKNSRDWEWFLSGQRNGFPGPLDGFADSRCSVVSVHSAVLEPH